MFDSGFAPPRTYRQFFIETFSRAFSSFSTKGPGQLGIIFGKPVIDVWSLWQTENASLM